MTYLLIRNLPLAWRPNSRPLGTRPVASLEPGTRRGLAPKAGLYKRAGGLTLFAARSFLSTRRAVAERSRGGNFLLTVDPEVGQHLGHAGGSILP